MGEKLFKLGSVLVVATCLLAAVVVDGNQHHAFSASAKAAYGTQTRPANMSPQSIGFYSNGCLAGAAAIPTDGPHWQVMRLARNRRFGHPGMVAFLQNLSEKAYKQGWNGLLIGDISQARGGPMVTGHTSHQIGLDADIWFTPMPNVRMTYQEREAYTAISMLKPGSNYVDDRRWNKSYENLLRVTANDPQVERVLVHPGIKKKLCDTVTGDRSWLNKVRPNAGHYYHFHIRIGCQAGSPNCRKQRDTTPGEGCDNTLASWFKGNLRPGKKTAEENQFKVKRPKRQVPDRALSSMPKSCMAVLAAAPKSISAATLYILGTGFNAPKIDIPPVTMASIKASRPMEANENPNAPSIASILSKRPGADQPPATTVAFTPPAEPVVSTASAATAAKSTDEAPAVFDQTSTQSIAKGATAEMSLSRIPIPTPRPGW